MREDLAFHQLDLQPGDVIFVRSTASAEVLEALAAAFTTHAAARGLSDVTLIVLGPSESIRELDAHVMRLHGWVRIEENMR